MAKLPFIAKKFANQIEPSGTLSVSVAQLIWGAITVGATPIALGAPPRPLIELCWRAALASASVEEDVAIDRWVKTDAYWRLDRSEKSAVSYFLGMTQAKITCALLLGIWHLIHLDAVLAAQGKTTRGSRPDLIGFDLVSMSYSVAVEAKGRTYGRTDGVIDKAKEQAKLLPTILSTTSNLRVASVASFEEGHWEAYLEDPPGIYQSVNAPPVESLAFLYYRPLVSALLAAGVDDEASTETLTVASLPDMDITLGLPGSIVSALRDVRPIDLVSDSEMVHIGQSILAALSSLENLAVIDRPRYSRVSGDEASTRGTYTGRDGVQVALGPSWF